MVAGETIRRPVGMLVALVATSSLLGFLPDGPARGATESSVPARTTHTTVRGAVVLSKKLTGVASLSETDVWSVGYVQPDVYHSRTLIRHWDGARWTTVKHPEPGGDDTLYDVDALSNSDVWAVGITATPQEQGSKTLVEHWDGTRWRVSASTNPADEFDNLYAVSADSASDVWVGGQTGTGSTNAALVEHYDGKTWTTVDVPPDMWTISSISALSALDVWATGVAVQDKVYSAVVLHWDGTDWTTEYSHDSVRHNGYGLSDLVALSSDDVWAVGVHDYRHGRGNPPIVPFALHWDGTAWTSTRTHYSADDAELTSVDASAPDDVWAVGTTGQCSCTAPLVEHWNGKAWKVIDVPYVMQPTTLMGVHATSGSDAWIVGGYRALLTLHWNGQRWHRY